MNLSNISQNNYSQVDITESTILEDTGKFNYFSPIVKITWGIICFILCAFIYYVGIRSAHTKSDSTTLLIIYYTGFHIFQFIGVFLIASMILDVLINRYVEKKSLLDNFLKRKIMFINISISFLTVAYSIKYSYAIVYNILVVIGLFPLFSVIRSGSREYIGYLMHLNNYYQKIKENDNDIKLIKVLNSVTGNKNIYRGEKYIKSVFKRLSPQNEPLTLETLCYFFSIEDANQIIARFRSRNITEEKFVTTWEYILQENEKFKKYMDHKDELLVKVDILCLFIGIPIYFFINLTFFDLHTKFQRCISVFQSVLLSLSFIFGGVVGDLFKSLIFIFLVKPYEVGDKIKMNNKEYIVEEIGLMYTQFNKNSLSVSIPNNDIMNSHIINYRMSECTDKIYMFNFPIGLFREKYKIIKDQISMTIKEFGGLLKEDFDLSDIEVISREEIKVKLTVHVNIHEINYETDLDKFSIRINDLINELKEVKNEEKNVHEI